MSENPPLNTRLLGYDMIIEIKPEAIDMISTCSASDVAKLIGIHPNTVLTLRGPGAD